MSVGGALRDILHISSPFHRYLISQDLHVLMPGLVDREKVDNEVYTRGGSGQSILLRLGGVSSQNAGPAKRLMALRNLHQFLEDVIPDDLIETCSPGGLTFENVEYLSRNFIRLLGAKKRLKQGKPHPSRGREDYSDSHTTYPKKEIRPFTRCKRVAECWSMLGFQKIPTLVVES